MCKKHCFDNFEIWETMKLSIMQASLEIAFAKNNHFEIWETMKLSIMQASLEIAFAKNNHFEI